MAKESGIEWTDATWNPVTGCEKVSEGCANCYAEKTSERLATMGQDKYQDVTEDGRWTGSVRVHPDVIDEPRDWPARRVFVCSMSDLFHPDVPVEHLDQVFQVMHEADQHIYQVLTKRPRRMAGYLKRELPWDDPEHGSLGDLLSETDTHIWVGTSVEHQDAADERIPALLDARASLRFLSCEPLLGRVDLTTRWCPACGREALGAVERELCPYCQTRMHLLPAPEGIDWVIAGGESGRDPRPVEPKWISGLIHQCRESGTPIFVKQLGSAWANAAGADDAKGGDPEEWPEAYRHREWPEEVDHVGR